MPNVLCMETVVFTITIAAVMYHVHVVPYWTTVCKSARQNVLCAYLWQPVAEMLLIASSRRLYALMQFN